MEEKSKQDELIRFFEENNYDKAVIDQARADFEAGLSAEQVSVYKVRRLKDAERSLISGAMRLKMPQELITAMVNHKYKETQYAAVIGEYESGTELSVINDVMKEFRTGHDINTTFAQVKERMANSMEKPPEPEPEGAAKEHAKMDREKTVEKQEAVMPGISSQDFMETMKMMMDTFSHTVQLQFDRMDKRDEELRQSSLTKDVEKMLNDRISALEGELADSRKDLSAASGVVSEKEQMIRNLQNDLENKDKTIRESLSKKEAEIKNLREEMERMKTGNHSGYSENTVSHKTQVTASENGNSDTSATTTTGSNLVSQTAMGNAGTGRTYTGNYATTMVMPDGRQIPIQVERTERKSAGLTALMSKLMPKGPAKTLLTRMIEGRYSGAQLSEVVYAYDKKLDEAEVQELLDANLPAEEMHGIIDVVAAAKGGGA